MRTDWVRSFMALSQLGASEGAKSAPVYAAARNRAQSALIHSSTGQFVTRYQPPVVQYSGTDVRDESGRLIAPPQSIYLERQPGPWDHNRDAR